MNKITHVCIDAYSTDHKWQNGWIHRKKGLQCFPIKTKLRMKRFIQLLKYLSKRE